MKRFLTIAIVAGLALGGSSMAFAAFCSLDQVPAATILYPFVQFDYNNPIQGENTLFAVTNVSAEPQVVHFTLWTDYSLHVLDWNVILSGYDVQNTAIRDILENGTLPNTGTEPFEAKSPNPEGPAIPQEGLPDQHDRDAAAFFMEDRCPDDGSFYPVYGPIPGGILSRIEDFLTASQTATTGIASCRTYSSDEFDVSTDFEDFWFIERDTSDVTWMYITADVVWTCNGMFPDSGTEYWNQPDTSVAPTDVETGPQAMYDNVLIGDIFYVNDEDRFSEAVPAAHLESADPSNMFTGANFFYHQYVDSYVNGDGDPAGQGLAEGDYREPLPTAWGFRWMYDGTVGTKVRVFKRASYQWYEDDGYGFLSQGVVHDLWMPGYDAGNPVDPPEEMYALDCRPYTYYAWDEDENPTSTAGGSTGPSCPPNTPECTSFRINILPLETQEVDISQFKLPEPEGVPATSGWMLLVFPYSNWDVIGTPNFDQDDDLYQTYVSVRYDAYGNFSAAMPAAVIGNYSCDSSDYLPWLHVGRYTMTQTRFAE